MSLGLGSDRVSVSNVDTYVGWSWDKGNYANVHRFSNTQKKEGVVRGRSSLHISIGMDVFTYWLSNQRCCQS